MNDRELLELAARAAEIRLEWDGHPDQWQPMYYEGKTYHRWNPLESDADAFRLMVALRMKVEVNETSIVVWLPQREDGETLGALYEYPQTVQDADYTIRYVEHLAATRRAITRAAAAVWKERE